MHAGKLLYVQQQKRKLTLRLTGTRAFLSGLWNLYFGLYYGSLVFCFFRGSTLRTGMSSDPVVGDFHFRLWEGCGSVLKV